MSYDLEIAALLAAEHIIFPSCTDHPLVAFGTRNGNQWSLYKIQLMTDLDGVEGLWFVRSDSTPEEIVAFLNQIYSTSSTLGVDVEAKQTRVDVRLRRFEDDSLCPELIGIAFLYDQIETLRVAAMPDSYGLPELRFE